MQEKINNNNVIQEKNSRFSTVLFFCLVSIVIFGISLLFFHFPLIMFVLFLVALLMEELRDPLHYGSNGIVYPILRKSFISQFLRLSPSVPLMYCVGWITDLVLGKVI